MLPTVLLQLSVIWPLLRIYEISDCDKWLGPPSLECSFTCASYSPVFGKNNILKKSISLKTSDYLKYQNENLSILSLMQVISEPNECNFTQDQIPLFQIIITFSQSLIFTPLRKLKSATDSPEPMRSAMMFGTDWIGPSLKGFDPGRRGGQWSLYWRF